MGCNFKNARKIQKWKKRVENIKMAKFEAPGIKELDFMPVWILKKLRRFVWKKLLTLGDPAAKGPFKRCVTIHVSIFSASFQRKIYGLSCNSTSASCDAIPCTLYFHLVDHPERGNRGWGRRLCSHSKFLSTLLVGCIENKNPNHSINKVKHQVYDRWLLDKRLRQGLGLYAFSFYLEKSFT